MGPCPVRTQLRYEAQQTMKFFGNEVVDGFDSVFISPVDFWLKFDNYIQYAHRPPLSSFEWAG
jgi:hypothetical protein